MSKTKYPLEYEVDNQGRRRVDLSDLNSFPRNLIYTTGSSPVYDIDMAVPSVYNVQLSHSGVAKFRLINIQSDRCVTVNIFILSGADRSFELIDDKDIALGSQYWMEGIILNLAKATKSYLLSVHNYGDGLNSVLVNWIRKG